MADQRFRAREIRLRVGRFRTGLDEPGFHFNAGGALGKNLRMRGSQIGWQRFKLRCHAATESYSPATSKQKSSSHRCRTPRLLWMSPVNPGQQVTKLRGRDRHHSVSRAWLQETAPLQALRKQACALAVMPDHLQQVAAPATEAEQVTIQRVAAQYFLYLQR